MDTPQTHRSAARRATLAASSTALVLILVKLLVGLSTGTVVVLASAVDSLSLIHI